MIPIVAGGVLYSLGAVLNLLNEPVLWPGVFQAHELFHLFVVAASMCHFYFMLTVVIPSDADLQYEPAPLPVRQRARRSRSSRCRARSVAERLVILCGPLARASCGYHRATLLRSRAPPAPAQAGPTQIGFVCYP